MLLKYFTSCSLILGVLLFGIPAVAGSLSGTAALTSDYVFRGISQTQDDPAVQAGFKYAFDAGWYTSIWGSGVEFGPETNASAEIDLVAGWSGALSDDWLLDVNLTRFWYPSTTIELDYTELIGTLTYAGNYWLMLVYSPDVFATDEAGVYAQAGARWPLSEAFRLEGAIGYYHLDDAYGDSYLHAQASAIYAFAPIELRLTLHATDDAAEDLFPGLAGSRVEFAVQASF